MWFVDRLLPFHIALLPTRSGTDEAPLSTKHMMPSTETRCIRAIGAMGLGALVVGATAGGEVAIGALETRALAVKPGKIGHLAIEELEVGRLHVRELVVEREQTPRGGPLDDSAA